MKDLTEDVVPVNTVGSGAIAEFQPLLGKESKKRKTLRKFLEKNRSGKR